MAALQEYDSFGTSENDRELLLGFKFCTWPVHTTSNVDAFQSPQRGFVRCHIFCGLQYYADRICIKFYPAMPNPTVALYLCVHASSEQTLSRILSRI